MTMTVTRSANLTPAWTPLRYHPIQTSLWRTKTRLACVVAGRGSGKSELAKRRVVRWLPIKKPWPDPLYFYALPTRDQAKRVAWQSIKNLIPPMWITDISESDLSITTIYGSKLLLLGMDKPARAEGVQYDGGVVDESSDQRPGVFDLSFGPAMTHRNPWCWRIGVPKRSGPGAREFKEFYELGMSGKDPEIASYTWPSSDILSPSQLRFALENLDEKDYNEQYNAMWETVGGCIFYAYDDVENLSDEAVYRPELPILVGSDFNVDPMAWVLAHEIDGRIYVFDEVFLRSTNTQQTLDWLIKRYGAHDSGWWFYGDASGRARHSSASMSDYLIIRGDERFRKPRIFYPTANPARADRFASTNRMLANAAKVRRLFVNPRCKMLRTDLLERAYKEGSNDPNDSGDLGHITDALGYLVHTRHPITAQLISPTPSSISIGR